MPKTKLTLEDIEEIKESKGNLSASEVQRKYGIGWERLQKIWNGVQDKTIQITKQDEGDNIQRELQHYTPHNTPENIVVEDFYTRLGQIETKMDRQAELMQNILDSLDAVSDIESDTQSILEKENKESYTLQDIGKSMQEYMDFSKTLLYCGITGFTVWQLLCKTWKHIETKPLPPPTAGLISAKPVETTRPSLFKKEIDPFEFN